MATNQPHWTWAPGPRNVFAIAAFIVLLLDALVFNGTITGWNGHTVLAIGLALFAAAWVF